MSLGQKTSFENCNIKFGHSYQPFPLKHLGSLKCQYVFQFSWPHVSKRHNTGQPNSCVVFFLGPTFPNGQAQRCPVPNPSTEKSPRSPPTSFRHRHRLLLHSLKTQRFFPRPKMMTGPNERHGFGRPVETGDQTFRWYLKMEGFLNLMFGYFGGG